MTNIEGAKRFILTTAVSSFAIAQKMDTHTVAHHTTGVSTCPTLRGANTFQHFLLFKAWCVAYTVSTYFYYTKAILMKQFTDNYCIWSPYRSVGKLRKNEDL